MSYLKRVARNEQIQPELQSLEVPKCGVSKAFWCYRICDLMFGMLDFCLCLFPFLSVSLVVPFGMEILSCDTVL